MDWITFGPFHKSLTVEDRELKDLIQNAELIEDSLSLYEEGAGKALAASGDKAPAVVVADPYDDLIGEMRRNRGTVRPAFLEFMKTLRRATVEDIAERVHGNEQTSEEAVRKNVERVNEDLAGKAIPIRFIVGSGYVHKEDSPA